MKNLLNSLSTIVAIVFTALTLFAVDREGGGGPGGGDHVKDRILLAKEYALKILRSSQCHQYFTPQQCQTMEKKLNNGKPITWHNDEKSCLRAVVDGKNQCVKARTTADLESPIEIDIAAVSRSAISFVEATILLIHEVGHAIKLSESLITDERVIKLLSKQSVELAQDILSSGDIGASTALKGPVNLQYCQQVVAALKKIYQREAIGASGLLRRGFDLSREIQKEHESFFDQIWKNIGEQGQNDIKNFLMTRTDALPDSDVKQSWSDEVMDFEKKLRHYTSSVQDELAEQKILVPAREIPPSSKDMHVHSLNAYYKNKTVYFEVCTYHYEDTHMVNATRFSECSHIEFYLSSSVTRPRVSSLESNRRLFGDGGVYQNFIVRGQPYSLWSYPEEEQWAFKNAGYDCEKKISDSIKRQ